MKQSLSVVVLFGLSVVGCRSASDATPNPSNKHEAGVSRSTEVSTSGRPVSHESPNKNPALTSQNADRETEDDVSGAYFISGKVPAEFAEIDFLALANIDENAMPAPFNGFIRPRPLSKKDYRLLNPRLNGKDLTFVSAAVGGISYSFEGAFARLGNFPMDPPDADEVVLSGTLRKLKSGNVIAEIKVAFTYSAGG